MDLVICVNGFTCGVDFELCLVYANDVLKGLVYIYVLSNVELFYYLVEYWIDWINTVLKILQDGMLMLRIPHAGIL